MLLYKSISLKLGSTHPNYTIKESQDSRKVLSSLSSFFHHPPIVVIPNQKNKKRYFFPWNEIADFIQWFHACLDFHFQGSGITCNCQQISKNTREECLTFKAIESISPCAKFCMKKVIFRLILKTLRALKNPQQCTNVKNNYIIFISF